jgi:excisionase family DNA binding protein
MTTLDDRRHALPESPFLTKAEAAAYMRVSPRTIDRWAAAGRIQRYRVGTSQSLRFKRAELDALVVPDEPEAGR